MSSPTIPFSLRSLGSVAAFAAVSASAVSGCASGWNSGWGPRATEANLAAIKPGMTQAEVLASVGRPTWVFGVRQDNLTIWNYRFNHNDCVIYQVSIRPDGTVRDAATGYDPICDGPGRARL